MNTVGPNGPGMLHIDSAHIEVKPKVSDWDELRVRWNERNWIGLVLHVLIVGKQRPGRVIDQTFILGLMLSCACYIIP